MSSSLVYSLSICAKKNEFDAGSLANPKTNKLRKLRIPKTEWLTNTIDILGSPKKNSRKNENSNVDFGEALQTQKSPKKENCTFCCTMGITEPTKKVKKKTNSEGAFWKPKAKPKNHYSIPKATNHRAFWGRSSVLIFASAIGTSQQHCSIADSYARRSCMVRPQPNQPDTNFT